MGDPQVRSLRRYVEVRNWWSLVLKEWRGFWPRILLASAATLGFDAWLAIRVAVWEMERGEGLAFVLSFIPFAGICIASLIVGYFTMRSDWRDRAELHLPSSPMSCAGVIWAKLLAAALGLALIAVVATTGTWIVARRSSMFYSAIISMKKNILWLKPWEKAIDITWVVICLILGPALSVAVGIFSFTIGTIVPRISGLIAAVVCVLTFYLAFAFAPHAMYIASFIPTPGLIVYKEMDYLEAYRKVIPLRPFWPALAAIVLLIFVAGKILESQKSAPGRRESVMTGELSKTISRQGIVIFALVLLAVIASFTHPWLSGSQLLVYKSPPGSVSMIGFTKDASASIPFEKTFSTAGVQRVDIQAHHGEITVVGTDSNSITLTGKLVAYGDTVEQAEKKLGFLQLNTQICGDVLEIVAKPDESVVSKWMGDAILRVEVPAGIAVSSALSFGDTTLEGIDGAIRVRTSRGGKIRVNSTRGDLDVEATGKIEVNDAEVTGRMRLFSSWGSIGFRGTLGQSNDIETGENAVTIEVPQSTCVQVDAASSRGDVSITLPIAGEISERSGETPSSYVGVLGEGAPTGELKVRANYAINISGL
jgi:hypothetical protein